MKHILQSVALLTAILFLPLAVSATSYSDGRSVMAEDAAVVVATVVAIDQRTRQVTLRGPESDEWTFTASPEVRNLAQVNRGDKVIISYYEGFALTLHPRKNGVHKDRYSDLEITRAELGEKPSARVTGRIYAVGIVKRIDYKTRRVTIEGKDRKVKLEVSEDVDMSKAKVGDAVEVDYIASYAVRVERAPKVSARLEMKSTMVAVGIGVEWGKGTLTLSDGSTHRFKVNGLSVIDVGISSIKAVGDVYNLVEARDLNGKYSAGEVGVAVGVGGSAISMQNRNGVVIQLRSTQAGVRLTLAPKGLTIKLLD